MRKLLFLLAFITITANAQKRKIKTFETDYLSLEYPKKWTKNNDSNPINIISLSPKSELKNTFSGKKIAQEQIVFDRVKIDTIGLRQHFDKRIKKAIKHGAPKIEMFRTPNLGRVYKMYVAYKGPTHDIQQIEYHFIKNNYTYTFYYIAKHENFDTYLPIAENVFKSIQFK